MSGIRTRNWTPVTPNPIITPVSTILLQENSFEPAKERAFFLLVTAAEIRDTYYYVVDGQIIRRDIGADHHQRVDGEAVYPTQTIALGHSVVTNTAYTKNHLPYTQPICLMAAGVRRPGRYTPTSFRISWPDLGLCPPLAGIFFCPEPVPARRDRLSMQLPDKKIVTALEAVVDLFIMKFVLPIRSAFRKTNVQRNVQGSPSYELTCTSHRSARHLPPAS